MYDVHTFHGFWSNHRKIHSRKNDWVINTINSFIFRDHFTILYMYIVVFIIALIIIITLATQIRCALFAAKISCVIHPFIMFLDIFFQSLPLITQGINPCFVYRRLCFAETNLSCLSDELSTHCIDVKRDFKLILSNSLRNSQVNDATGRKSESVRRFRLQVYGVF